MSAARPAIPTLSPRVALRVRRWDLTRSPARQKCTDQYDRPEVADPMTVSAIKLFMLIGSRLMRRRQAGARPVSPSWEVSIAIRVDSNSFTKIRIAARLFDSRLRSRGRVRQCPASGSRGQQGPAMRREKTKQAPCKSVKVAGTANRLTFPRPEAPLAYARGLEGHSRRSCALNFAQLESSFEALCLGQRAPQDEDRGRNGSL
jgi:hypothetical protein